MVLIWAFQSQSGLPPVIIHGFSRVNHPAIGYIPMHGTTVLLIMQIYIRWLENSICSSEGIPIFHRESMAKMDTPWHAPFIAPSEIFQITG